jgi:hypothetical protein
MNRQQEMAARAGPVRAGRHDHARVRSVGRNRVDVVPPLTAFVGANQWLYVLVGACPASFVPRRALHLRSVIYDNDSAADVAQGVTA